MLNNKLLFYFIIFSKSVFGQINALDQANSLYNDQKYSLAQALYSQVIIDEGGGEEIEYYYARCSKELFHLDAEDLYLDYLLRYPSGQFSSQANEDLGLIYFRQNRYLEAIK